MCAAGLPALTGLACGAGWHGTCVTVHARCGKSARSRNGARHGGQAVAVPPRSRGRAKHVPSGEPPRTTLEFALVEKNLIRWTIPVGQPQHLVFA